MSRTGRSVQIYKRQESHDYTAIFELVLEEENVARFASRDGQHSHSLPLDCMVTVYESWDTKDQCNKWHLYLHTH